MGSRHSRETDEFGTAFFFFERDVNERASSDMGEAGFNEMRVQRDRVQFHGGGDNGEGSQREIRVQLPAGEP